ncbi:4Fe-4S dicluster protein [Anseongella ginsenosidimutans]|uniref:4Fe-4S dicluster protein n=1 Tax=Anseongella ginsenosidimutans TaxID=496056 RepID=A0A4R3KQ82_9SPHI|nr:4Fe-4S dicluster domain-containing protein [Anseongella ginsenosidimutans]QEC53921.1 4Fe-4S dicluster domain-containing protein [Anseongella ginsenosidimutans]TCS86307.1 4Fe-4S dicluster protein [Anseongella ginsenosidimutans]
MTGQLIFILLLIAGVGWFVRNVRKIRRNIRLGRPVNRSDRKATRWKVMSKVALGQSKMTRRPVAGIMHILIYAGFIIINIEVLEIIIDGIFGTHRIFGTLAPGLYALLIASFEYLALGVILACVVFLARRNILRLRRFSGVEMTAWPKSDANFILIAEILLMSAFLTMNGADYVLQLMGSETYVRAGAFPVSSQLMLLLPGTTEGLIFVERFCWWFHIIGILAFLNYIPYSKHFHIFLSFPNTWYANLEPRGRFTNMEAVTQEVKALLDPAFTPASAGPPERFGAKDVRDLSRVNLMNAYSCTECGRCTAVCPANITGKLLSPRKIMMDTRDRLEEVGKNIDRHGKDHNDGKSLLGDYISTEELWACTTCNACVEACPVLIDPLEIITELKRSLVLEDSRSPQGWNTMFNNIENNAAPWQFPPTDRLKWTEST